MGGDVVSDLEKIDKHPSGTWRKINRHVSGAERYVYSTDEGQSWAPRKGGAIPPQPTPADSDPGLATVTDDVYAGLSAEERAWADRPAVDPDAPPAASPEPERVDPAISVPLDAAPKPAAGRELDMWETLAKYAPGQDTQDAIAGAVAGGGFGWGEELGAGLLEMLPDPEGYDRSQRGDVKANMLRQMRKEDAQAQERSPYLYGGAAIASQIPMAIATQGALPAGTGAGARMLAGGLEGTVQGMVTGAGMANEGDRGEGARIGGAHGGLGGAAIPGLGVAGGMARKGAGKLVDRAADLKLAAAQKAAPAAARQATAGAPEELRDVAVEVASSPEKRAALLRHDRGRDQAVTDITQSLSKMEETTDAVITYGKLAMKREPIVSGIVNDGVNPDVALLRADAVMEEVGEMLANDVQKARGNGLAAINRLIQGTKGKRAIQSPLQKAINDVRSGLAKGGSEGAGDTFMSLDHFKREVGKSVKAASARQGEPDADTVANLKGLYEHIRQLLEHKDTWGSTAAGAQQEINAAWVPWINKTPGMQKLLMTEQRGLVGADAWEPSAGGRRNLPEAHPRKVSGVLREAGTVEGDFDVQTMREGIQANQAISEVLAKHYDIPEGAKRMAADARHQTAAIMQNLDQVIDDNRLAMSMADVAAEGDRGLVSAVGKLSGLKQLGETLEVAPSGSPAASMRRLGRMEEDQVARQANPRTYTPEPRGDWDKRTMAEGVGTGAGSGSLASRDDIRELGRTANSTSDAIEQLVTTDPYALEDWGPRLAEAKQRGNFAAEFSKMQQTDPQFRQRVQQLEQEMFQ